MRELSQNITKRRKIDIPETASIEQKLRVLSQYPMYFTLWEYLSEQQPADHLLVDDVITALTLPNQRAVKMLKKLQLIGCGRFIIGRRGLKTRLEWLYPVEDILAVALGQKEYLHTQPKHVTTLGSSIQHLYHSRTLHENSAHYPQITHRFNLRADAIVHLELPIDLTEQEAERLAKFISVLPFMEK